MTSCATSGLPYYWLTIWISTSASPVTPGSGFAGTAQGSVSELVPCLVPEGCIVPSIAAMGFVVQYKGSAVLFGGDQPIMAEWPIIKAKSRRCLQVEPAQEFSRGTAFEPERAGLSTTAPAEPQLRKHCR